MISGETADAGVTVMVTALPPCRHGQVHAGSSPSPPPTPQRRQAPQALQPLLAVYRHGARTTPVARGCGALGSVRWARPGRRMRTGDMRRVGGHGPVSGAGLGDGRARSLARDE